MERPGMQRLSPMIALAVASLAVATPLAAQDITGVFDMGLLTGDAAKANPETLPAVQNAAASGVRGTLGLDLRGKTLDERGLR